VSGCNQMQRGQTGYFLIDQSITCSGYVISWRFFFT